MLTAVLKAVKMLLFYCPKNSQDAAVLAALKAVQDAEKTTPTNTKYRDLFPSAIDQVRILHVSTTSQFTDIFTKELPSVFNEFQSSLNICSS
jgi:hypothetical protein